MFVRYCYVQGQKVETPKEVWNTKTNQFVARFVDEEEAKWYAEIRSLRKENHDDDAGVSAL